MEINDRNGRDAAGIGPYAREREALTALSTLDSWKVSEGEPDIRGWDIRTVSGRQLGSVADLLVDADAGEVVMIDVDLPGTDRHTFVPIRVVQIDRARRLVLMDSADLPDSDLARGERGASPVRRGPDSGTVRYPRADREIIPDRALLADAVPAADPLPLTTPHDMSASDVVHEKRRTERRRIDRLSTDL